MGLIPEQHNYLTLTELEALKKQLVFTEKENREYDIESKQAPDGRWYLTFNEESATGYTKEITIGARALAAIVEQLKKLDKSNMLDFRTIALYKKFVGGNKDGDSYK